MLVSNTCDHLTVCRQMDSKNLFKIKLATNYSRTNYVQTEFLIKWSTVSICYKTTTNQPTNQPYMYFATPPHGQDVTQSPFLNEV